MTTLRRFTFVLALAVLSGCAGTEIGNPQTDQTTNVQFEFAPLPVAANALTLASGIEVDRAWLAVEEIRFRPDEACLDIDETSPLEEDYIGPQASFSIDVVTGELDPPLEPFGVPAQAYCRFELELDSESSDDLEPYSIIIEGTLADGRPFEILIEEDAELELRGDFTLSPGDATLFLAFDLESWLIPEQFQDLEEDADGVVRVSSNSDEAEDVADAIFDAIDRSLTLFRDLNANGVIDLDTDEIIARSSTDNE